MRKHIAGRLHLAPVFRRKLLNMPFETGQPDLGRRGRPRPRVPHPQHRAAQAGQPRTARQARRPPALQPARPQPPAVGVLRDRRPADGARRAEGHAPRGLLLPRSTTPRSTARAASRWPTRSSTSARSRARCRQCAPGAPPRPTPSASPNSPRPACATPPSSRSSSCRRCRHWRARVWHRLRPTAAEAAVRGKAPKGNWFAPRTPLNVAITNQRSFASLSLPLAEARRIAKGNGVDDQRRRAGDLFRRAAPLPGRHRRAARRPAAGRRAGEPARGRQHRDEHPGVDDARQPGEPTSPIRWSGCTRSAIRAPRRRRRWRA